MLYLPDAFEPLTDEPWDESRVGHAIRDIVAGAEESFDPAALWPVAGDWDAWVARLPLTNLYAGAAGAIWALDALRRRGHADVGLDLGNAAHRTVEAWREALYFSPSEESAERTDASLFFGGSGLLLVDCRLAHTEAFA